MSISTRLFLLFAAILWAVMNLLLWQTQYGKGNQIGSDIPISLVWEKMITAPDPSELAILRNNTKIGFCRWEPTIIEPEDRGTTPEGMIEQAKGYTLKVEGNFLGKNLSAFSGFRFSFLLELSDLTEWERLRFQILNRPNIYEIESIAEKQTLGLRFYENDAFIPNPEASIKPLWEYVSDFETWKNPEKLIKDLGGFESWGLPVSAWTQLLPMDQLTRSRAASNSSTPSPITWTAHNDWIQFGHSRIRVYRIHAKLSEAYQLTATISRVGEILLVELPGGFVLRNDSLIAF